jgi:excisionase family DNA binding protein
METLQRVRETGPTLIGPTSPLFPFSNETDMKAPHTAALSPFMTGSEVARYLQLDICTLRKLVREGKIPALKIGTNYRFSKDAIERLIIN